MPIKSIYAIGNKEWSHWDHAFPPTLGQIVNWIEGNSNDLLYLVLRSGKMDEFLPTIVKGPIKEMVA